jgi:hypothetical protein
MALQYSTTLRNAQLDAVETTIGTSPKLQIRTGAPPANCAAADSGNIITTIDLPSDWLAASSSGSKAKAGTWTNTASLAGTNVAGHFRIKETGATTCYMQGTITVTGGGGDLELDSVSIMYGQSITVTGFSLAAGNA